MSAKSDFYQIGLVEKTIKDVAETIENLSVIDRKDMKRRNKRRDAIIFARAFLALADMQHRVNEEIHDALQGVRDLEERKAIARRIGAKAGLKPNELLYEVSRDFGDHGIDRWMTTNCVNTDEVKAVIRAHPQIFWYDRSQRMLRLSHIARKALDQEVDWMLQGALDEVEHELYRRKKERMNKPCPPNPMIRVL